MPKISQFPAGGSAQNTDLIPVVRNGGDYTITGYNLASLASYGQAYVGTFTATAGQTVFTLPASPGSLANLFISVDGAVMVPGSDYTWTTPVTLTFAVGLKVGQTVLYNYTTSVPIGTSLAGGVSGQVQYNNSGVLNGTTIGGDATLVATTGALTVTKTNGVAFAASATTNTTLTGNINYTQGGTGSVTRTVTNKLQELVSVKDFGAVGDGVTDDTAALNAASASCALLGKSLFVPSGTYKTTGTWNIGNINVEFEDASNTKIQCVGNFTAVKFLSVRNRFKNFNVWFTPPVSSAAVGYQFGNGASQFARNVVENFYVRYAYTSYFNSSDMWGNVFTQINSDFGINGYDFTGNPGGTTNSFRNIYATGLKTTGTISSGSNSLVVADSTNLIAGLTVAVIGAGTSAPLITTISTVVGTTVTLTANASTSVSDARVFVKGKGFNSVNFSDTHIYDGYFDGYASFGASTNAIVYTSDSLFCADSLRFEGCAVLGNNFGIIDDRSSDSNIGSIVSYGHYIDVGAGNIGYIYRCGTGAMTNHMLNDVTLAGFSYSSGTLNKVFLAANDTIVIDGQSVTTADCSDNGFEGGLFRQASAGRVLSVTPATGSWDIADTYINRGPIVGGPSGGVCTAAGTFGTLNGGATTAITVSGSSQIIVNSLVGLSRNQFINIAGVTGTFKVIDIQSGSTNYVILSASCGASVSGAAVSFATPTFARSGSIELLGTTTWDPASVPIGGSVGTTLTVTGAAVGDYVIASFSQSLQFLQLTAYVYAANSVAVNLTNSLAGAVDLASGTLRVRVIKQ